MEPGPGRGESLLRRRLRLLFTLVLLFGGLALLASLAREIGIDPVVANARALAWFVPAGLAIHVAVHIANTLGWRYAIGSSAGNVSFPRLFAVWAAGDLVNWGTPGSIGGEFLRAHLVRDRVPLSVGIASVTVARLAQSLAQFAFIAAGLALAWTRLDLPSLHRIVLTVVVTGGLLFLTLVYYIQRTRTFGHAVTAARGAGLAGRFLDRIETALGHVDAHIRDYHRDLTGDFRRSVACYFAGWALQMLEVPAILWAFDAPVDWRAVVAIESLATLVEAVAFMVPGKVGVDEGGRVLIFQALGHASALGLGFSLFRRARELVWFSLCLLFMVVEKRRADAASTNLRSIAKDADDG
jgi:uncharacterized protein (TIRG00374 family)